MSTLETTAVASPLPIHNKWRRRTTAPLHVRGSWLFQFARYAYLDRFPKMRKTATHLSESGESNLVSEPFHLNPSRRGFISVTTHFRLTMAVYAFRGDCSPHLACVIILAACLVWSHLFFIFVHYIYKNGWLIIDTQMGITYDIIQNTQDEIQTAVCTYALTCKLPFVAAKPSKNAHFNRHSVPVRRRE